MAASASFRQSPATFRAASWRTRSLASIRLRLQGRPQGPGARQQQQQQQRLLPAAAYRGGGGGRQPRRSGRPPGRSDPTELVKQYALPGLGLLLAASLVGPLVGGLVFSALSLGVAIAAAAAFFSVSSVFLPVLVAVFGFPALMAGGMAAGVFATIAGGALLLPSLIQLVLVGGGLWLGASVAQRLFFAGGGGGEGGVNIGPNGTIDVEAETVDDRDWRDEVFRERKEREAELREFDDLLKRREDFKNRGPRP
ncbi:hypothetical protein ABPG77_000159 [Micractinium sp. CCAP 211/92]